MPKINNLKTELSNKAKHYTYEIKDAPEIGEGAIHVKIVEGKHEGKVAVVIKMPDEFSGFFPEMSFSEHEEQPTQGFLSGLFGHNKSLKRTL